MMKPRQTLYNMMYVLVAAVLFYLASPNILSRTGFPVCAWIFAVPLFVVLDGKGLRERLLYGTLFSLTAYLLILSWIINISVFLFLVFSLLFAIQPVFFAALYRSRTCSKMLYTLYIPALWVVTEAVRGYLLGGYEWTIGHSQTFLPVLVQLADITGAYGISFIILLVNGCFYVLWRERGQDRRYLVIAALAFLLLVIYGGCVMKQGEDGNHYSVCAIQPDLSSAQKGNPDLIDAVVDQQADLTERCLEGTPPDLIVWPETAITDDFLRDKVLRQTTLSLSRKVKTPMLIGSALLIDGKNYNSAVLLTPDGKVQGIYHKRHLLPFQEYFPFQKGFSFFHKVFGIKNYDFQRRKGRQVLPFYTDSDTIKGLSHQGSFGVAICSEEGYPRSIRRQVLKGAQFLVAMLNDAWFQSDAAIMMHAQDGLMQAATFKMPVVRSSNSGLSCAIDRYGRIQNQKKAIGALNQKAVFRFDIRLDPQQTFFCRFGNIFVVICAIFVVGVLIGHRKKRAAL